MQIRFKQYTQIDNVVFQAGEVKDLPEQLAKLHIAAGDAVLVPKAETAVLHTQTALPIPRPARNSTRRGRR